MPVPDRRRSPRSFWLLLLTIGLLGTSLTGCFPETEPHRAGLIAVTNPQSGSWANAPVTVDLEAVDLAGLEGPVRTYRKTPTGWSEIASQLTDTDGDGTPDQLFFLLNMAGETTTRIELVAGGWPTGYRRRADAMVAVRPSDAEPTTQYQPRDTVRLPSPEDEPAPEFFFGGPVWESTEIGYRSIVDAQSRTDVVGKTVARMRMRTVNPQPDTIQAWGSALLPDRGRTGIGTPFLETGDGAVSLAEASSRTIAVTADGPLQGILTTTYRKVPTAEDPITVTGTKKIQAEGRWTDQRLQVAAESDPPSAWSTGLVRAPSSPTLYRDTTEQVAIFYTWGRQTAQGDSLGTALLVPRELEPEVIDRDTLDHWIRMDATESTIRYRYLASWNLESDALLTLPAFEATLRQIARRWMRPPRVRRIADSLETSTAVPQD